MSKFEKSRVVSLRYSQILASAHLVERCLDVVAETGFRERQAVHGICTGALIANRFTVFIFQQVESRRCQPVPSVCLARWHGAREKGIGIRRSRNGEKYGDGSSLEYPRDRNHIRPRYVRTWWYCATFLIWRSLSNTRCDNLCPEKLNSVIFMFEFEIWYYLVLYWNLHILFLQNMKNGFLHFSEKNVAKISRLLM